MKINRLSVIVLSGVLLGSLAGCGSDSAGTDPNEKTSGAGTAPPPPANGTKPGGAVARPKGGEAGTATGSQRGSE